MRLAYSLAALLLVAHNGAEAQAPDDVDHFVTSVMKEFEVPGVGLAVVKDGKVVVARGYGVRSLSGPEPVDEHTRFGIASNTKLFTATALMMLADEGKLSLDSPVIRYLPWFLMSDTAVTRQMTIRDLLVHRSGLGLGAGDLLWWPQTNYGREDLVRRLRYVPLATPFRRGYAYDNVLYTVAGEVIESASESSGSRIRWEDFIDRRILKRLGMSDANVHHSAAAGAGNVAVTHARVDGIVRRVPPMTGDNTNPAGGINASASDMAKWLIVQLDSGRLADGSRLFSQNTARELWTLVTPIPFGTPPRELSYDNRSYNGYGLGIGVRDYRGIPILLHTGSLPGYASRILMIPSLKLGIAVLTNQESVEAHDAIAFHIADQYLGVRNFDHLKAYSSIAKRNDADAARLERASVTSRDSTALPSLPTVKYAGTYRDRWYGNVVITQDDVTKLGIRFTRTPALIGELVHWEKDTFLARWRDRSLRADAFVTFHVSADHTVDRVTMSRASPLSDFSYDFQDLDLRPIRSIASTNGPLTDSVRFAWTYGIDQTEGYARRIRGFGGLWVERDGKETHVFLTNLADSTFARRVLWKHPAIVFHQGKYDFIQLDLWRYRIAREVLAREPNGGIGHGIREQKNQIGFAAENAALAEIVRRMVRDLGIPSDAVFVEITGPIRLLEE